MSESKNYSASLLREIWASLFQEENIKSSEPDIEYQGMSMLLETALSKFKVLSVNNESLKSSTERHLLEIERKTQENEKLKLEIQRLGNVCERCSTLEGELKHFKKKAFEAQNRMKSIANILKLGDTIQESQSSPRKCSAYNLVSQMLLEDSPKRKKRCLPKNGQWEETIINEEKDIRNCDTVIPVDLPPPADPVKTPQKIETSKKVEIDMISSPGDDSPLQLLGNKSKLPLTINLSPIPRQSPARRALMRNCQKESSPRTQIVPETEQNSMELNGSLAEYMKGAGSELDKIWFSNDSGDVRRLEEGDTGKRKEGASGEQEKTPGGQEAAEVMGETPEATPSRKKSVWKLKETRGPLEKAGNNRRVRQMKLSVSRREKAREVDISSHPAFDGGSISPAKQGSQSAATQYLSRTPLTQRNTPPESSKCGEKEVMDLDDVNTEKFSPAVTSTQRLDFAEPGPSKPRKGKGSPDYKYKGPSVRAKSERAKLPGWDCEKCAKYYEACGEMSPSKIKSRMDKCSRHRDKFEQVSNTPPGYWNPIYPDTQDIKKMYRSIHVKKNND